MMEFQKEPIDPPIHEKEFLEKFIRECSKDHLEKFLKASPETSEEFLKQILIEFKNDFPE